MSLFRVNFWDFVSIAGHPRLVPTRESAKAAALLLRDDDQLVPHRRRSGVLDRTVDCPPGTSLGAAGTNLGGDVHQVLHPSGCLSVGMYLLCALARVDAPDYPVMSGTSR